MSKKLYLMRHGQTLFNAQKRIQGWCDSPLTEEGIKQAKDKGTYFKENNIKIDQFYSSTSERCSDTLEYAFPGVNYTRLKGLKERGFGSFEGQPEYLNPKFPYGDFFVEYGGESESVHSERINSTINELMNKEDENILCVTHAGSIYTFLGVNGLFEIAPKELFSFTNCSVVVLNYEDGKYTWDKVLI